MLHAALVKSIAAIPADLDSALIEVFALGLLDQIQERVLKFLGKLYVVVAVGSGFGGWNGIGGRVADSIITVVIQLDIVEKIGCIGRHRFLQTDPFRAFGHPDRPGPLAPSLHGLGKPRALSHLAAAGCRARQYAGRNFFPLLDSQIAMKLSRLLDDLTFGLAK